VSIETGKALPPGFHELASDRARERPDRRPESQLTGVQAVVLVTSTRSSLPLQPALSVVVWGQEQEDPEGAGGHAAPGIGEDGDPGGRITVGQVGPGSPSPASRLPATG